MIARPVCVACAIEMRCVKNSFAVRTSAGGFPHEVYSGDKYQCGGCANEVVVGFGRNPVASRRDAGSLDRWATCVDLDLVEES